MGDSDSRDSGDDPFETYLGTTTDEPEDFPVARSWTWPRDVFTRPVWAIAAIVLATASLLGIAGGQTLAEFLSIDSGGFGIGVTGAVVDASFGGIAVVFAILGLRADEELESTWHRSVAAAAILVAVLSVFVNLAAVSAGLHATLPNPNSSGFVSTSG